MLIEETYEILIDKPNLVRFKARRAQVPLGQEAPLPAISIATSWHLSMAPVHRALRNQPEW